MGHALSGDDVAQSPGLGRAVTHSLAPRVKLCNTRWIFVIGEKMIIVRSRVGLFSDSYTVS